MALYDSCAFTNQNGQCDSRDSKKQWEWAEYCTGDSHSYSQRDKAVSWRIIGFVWSTKNWNISSRHLITCWWSSWGLCLCIIRWFIIVIQYYTCIHECSMHHHNNNYVRYQLQLELTHAYIMCCSPSDDREAPLSLDDEHSRILAAVHSRQRCALHRQVDDGLDTLPTQGWSQFELRDRLHLTESLKFECGVAQSDHTRDWSHNGCPRNSKRLSEIR